MLALGWFGCSNEDRAPLAPIADAQPSSDVAQPIDAPELVDAAPKDQYTPPDVGTYDFAILSFVAAQVYHDFPALTQKSGSKFEVFLVPSVRPGQITQLRVSGPNDFVFDFSNEPFVNKANGYLINPGIPTLWYQAFREEPLEDGVYTVRVSFDNGEVEQFSRELRTNHALLDFYIAHAKEMVFSPSGGVSPANDTVLTWTTLHDLGGPDAVYIGWISSGTTDAITPNSARGDNVYLDALFNPRAGINVGSSRKGWAENPLPLGPQTWHPEITDSNRLDGVNITIFPPAQHFTAE